MSEDRSNPSKGTFRELVTDKRKPGRPRHTVQRQSVYVELSPDQKIQIGDLGRRLARFKRSDVPDMAVMTLATRIEAIRIAVAGRAREMPEGITDMQSLYFLWDIPPVGESAESKWTSIRLSPQQVDEFGSLQGRFSLLFGANRSHVFTLALALFAQLVTLEEENLNTLTTLEQFNRFLTDNYLHTTRRD